MCLQFWVKKKVSVISFQATAMVTGIGGTCQLVLYTVIVMFTLSVNANHHSNDHWPSLNQVLNEINWPLRRHVINSLHEIISSPDLYTLSSSCNHSLQYFVDGLEKNREDAFRMLDSWSKVSPGFLSGQYVDFGHWEQCIETTMQSNTLHATGQYCLYHLSWPLLNSIREDLQAFNRHNDTWIKHLIADSDAFRFAKVAGATCLPSTCSRDEIQSIVHKCKFSLTLSLSLSLHCKCLSFDSFYFCLLYVSRLHFVQSLQTYKSL